MHSRFGFAGQVCFRCTASKGNDVFGTVFTDVSSAAQWRLEEAGPIWDVQPAVSRLFGFSEKLVSLDLLHVCHLGIMRDFLGTGFKLLTRKKDEYYSGQNITKRLSQLFAELKRFCKDNKLVLSMQRLKKNNLSWRGDCCPELRVKGADALICLRFLSWKLQNQPHTVYDDLVISAWSLENFLGCLSDGNMFLSPAESSTCYTLGSLFIRSYLRSANMSLQSGELYFKVRPKLHVLLHVVEDMQPSPEQHPDPGVVRNPSFDATFMDEDFVKHVLNLKKRMSFKTASLNVLQRCCTVNKMALDAVKP